MRSHELTEEQMRRIKEAIDRFDQYLTAMQTRMAERGFPDDDPLKVATAKASVAVQQYLGEVMTVLRNRRNSDRTIYKMQAKIRERHPSAPLDDWPEMPPFR